VNWTKPKREVHTLYYFELPKGACFQWDVQHVWDDDVRGYVDGVALGSFMITLQDNGEVSIEPIGYVGFLEESNEYDI
jgi:hypothetical protein